MKLLESVQFAFFRAVMLLACAVYVLRERDVGFPELQA